MSAGDLKDGGSDTYVLEHVMPCAVSAEPVDHVVHTEGAWQHSF